MKKDEITHMELCEKTAKRFIKENDVGVFEYQSYASSEFPDVLLFKDSRSTLFEIKVSRSDFLGDQKKECRIKWRPKGWLSYFKPTDKMKPAFVKWKTENPELYYIERPHLGIYRYYVCPYEMISPEEVPEGWGLYWYKGGRFYHKKSSKKFRRNLFKENAILTHAIRKLGNYMKHGHDYEINIENIIISDYSKMKKREKTQKKHSSMKEFYNNISGE